MNAQASQGKVTILAVAVALLLVGAVVAYTYYGTKTNGVTRLSSSGPSTTATGIVWTYFNSTVSPDGLQVEVALNMTSVLVAKGLSAQVFLTNTLPTNVSLSANLTADSALEALSASPCEGAGLLGLLNVGLYQGHYTAANFSQEAVPLFLFPWFLISCPNPFYYVHPYIQSVKFAPNSHEVTLSGQPTDMRMGLGTGNCTLVPYKSGPSTIIVNGSTTTSSGGTQLDLACGGPGEGLTGYWTMPPENLLDAVSDPHPYSNSTMLQGIDSVYECCSHQFTPGSYTIVAEDYWNQAAFGYFEVVS